MFWKKKKKQACQESPIILGMIMLQEESSYNIDFLINEYNNSYSEHISEFTGDDTTSVFTIDGESVAIAHMPVPIPIGDIESTAPYAYNWQNALQELNDHRSHFIVSVLQGSNDKIKRFKLFTQVVCALLKTTNAIGVYMGNQSLLIPKEDYLSEADFMSDDYLPLNLWVYFGIRVSDMGNAGYTYGLKEFGKTELEIIGSAKTPAAIREFLFNMAHYVLQCDVTFEDGQTCGVSEDEKIGISLSKGRLVEGETFKLAY